MIDINEKEFNLVLEDEVIEEKLFILPKTKVKLSGTIVIKNGIVVNELGELYIENSNLYFYSNSGIICKGKLIAINSKFDANELFWKNIIFSGKLSNNSKMINCSISNDRGITLFELIENNIGKDSIWNSKNTNFDKNKTFGGGILIVSAEKILFENINIENCCADIGGGIAYTECDCVYNTILFKNCNPSNIFDISQNRFVLNINKKEILLDINESFDLKAEAIFIDGNIENNFSFEIENTDIAIVVNRKVIAKNIGSTYLNAIFRFQNKEYKISSKIVVLKKLVSIKIIPTELSLIKGETHQLKAIGEFNDGTKTFDFIWSSSDYEICFIDSNGLLTANKPGKAIITATNKEYNKNSSINVNVKNLLHIETNVNQINLLVGDTYKLKAIGKFDDGTKSNEIQWESFDTQICSVNKDGLLTANNPGITKIKAFNEKYDKYSTIIVNCKSYIDMVFVEGGIFEIGDFTGLGYQNEKPVSKITISNFYISKYLVTQKEYKSITGINPSFFLGDYLPVENVSWYDAINYCNLLSKKENLPVAYNENGELIDMYGRVTNDITKVKGYRLPTEAEWEYAARGGSKTSFYRYSGSNDPDQVAWYYNNSNNRTHEIALKKANELGIYDMSGNVWEWVYDWYDPNYYFKISKNNPFNFTKSNYKVIRGGSWANSIRALITSFREFDIPKNLHSNLGFRFAKSF